MQIKTQVKASNLSYLDNRIEKFSLNGDATMSKLPIADLKLSARNISVNKQMIKKVDAVIKPSKVTNKQVKHEVDIVLKHQDISTDLELFLTQEADNWLVFIK